MATAEQRREFLAQITGLARAGYETVWALRALAGTPTDGYMPWNKLLPESAKPWQGWTFRVLAGQPTGSLSAAEERVFLRTVWLLADALGIRTIDSAAAERRAVGREARRAAR